MSASHNQVAPKSEAPSTRQLSAKIFLVSAVGLLLEMMLIRWIGTEIRIFAYLQNTVLIVCFLGLGVGCFASRKPIRLPRGLAALAVLTAILSLPAIRPLTARITDFLSVLGDLVIWEQLTCLEQLEFMGQQYDLSRKLARQRALDLLDLLGLRDRRNKLAKTLSGGMKRRLNIALALVHSPDILILDEPQAGLDPQSRILVRDYIRSLAGHMTVILTTHEMDEADRLADRIAVIDHGHLLVLDTADNLKNIFATLFDQLK